MQIFYHTKLRFEISKQSLSYKVLSYEVFLKLRLDLKYLKTDITFLLFFHK